MMEKSMVKYDKYEFINAVIGWLGTKELYLEVLNVSESQLNALIQSESEEFEEQLTDSMSRLSIADMNKLSEKYALDCSVTPIYK